jgi:hypothetical protein
MFAAAAGHMAEYRAVYLLGSCRLSCGCLVIARLGMAEYRRIYLLVLGIPKFRAMSYAGENRRFHLLGFSDSFSSCWGRAWPATENIARFISGVFS